MEKQSWQGNQLDKDLLVEGNKVYSPETCVFVSQGLNTFLLDGNSYKGGLLRGVTIDSRDGAYQAQCKQLGGGNKHLGRYKTQEEAHDAYIQEKKRLAVILAEEQSDSRASKALLSRSWHWKGDK